MLKDRHITNFQGGKRTFAPIYLKISAKEGETFSKTQLDEALNEQTITMQNIINDSINKLREEIIDRLLLETTKLSTRIKELEENVITLEKSVIKKHQYQRNNNIVITGIPKSVEHDILEDQCIKIINEINEHKLEKRDLEASHRISVVNNGVTIKFANRKDANECLKNRSNLKYINKELIGLPKHTTLFMDEQLSPYISKLAYMCRCLKRSNLISKHKLQKELLKFYCRGEMMFIFIRKL